MWCVFIAWQSVLRPKRPSHCKHKPNNAPRSENPCTTAGHWRCFLLCQSDCGHIINASMLFWYCGVWPRQTSVQHSQKYCGFWWPSVPDTVPGSTQSGKWSTTPWSDPNNTARHHGNHPSAHGHTSGNASHNFPNVLTQILITFTRFPGVRGARCSHSNTFPPFQDAKISLLLYCLLPLSVVSFQ